MDINRGLLTGLAATTIIMLGSSLVGCATTKGDTPDEKRAYTDRMSEDALSDLYEQRPDLKSRVESAAGYGTFSNIGTNLLFISTGGGFGMVHDNDTGKSTYMKMAEFGVGIGLGVKDFRAVFIFNDASTMQTFITSGWEWGGEADAAAKVGDQGGAAEAAGAVGPIEVYQITKNGIALSATVSGTKYWKDTALNAP